MNWKAPLACLLVVVCGLALSDASRAWSPLLTRNFNYGDIRPDNVQIIDFDRDGRNDVVMVNAGGSGAHDMGFSYSVMFLKQKPDGSLAAPVTIHKDLPGSQGNFFHTAHVADLNRDGRMDMLVSENVFMVVKLQKPDGTFASTEHLQTDHIGPQGITRFVLYDANQDGIRDVIGMAWSDYLAVYLMNADGSVRATSEVRVPNNDGYSDIDLGDVDHDGKEDLVYSSGQGFGPHFSVLGSDGNGSLKVRTQFGYQNYAPSSVAIGDFDNDGREEIATATGMIAPTTVEVIKLDNALGIREIRSLPTEILPYDLVAGDVNGDGLDDLSLIHRRNGEHMPDRVGRYLQVNGRLVAETTNLARANHFQSNAMAVGDINSDRCPDTVIADNLESLQIVYGSGCSTTPLPTVDFGLTLGSYMALAYEGPPALYDRSITVTYRITGGNEIAIEKPRIRVILSALPGHVVEAGSYSEWGACSVVSQTPARMEFLCIGATAKQVSYDSSYLQFPNPTTENFGNKQEFVFYPGPQAGTRIDVRATVESDSVVADTNIVNQLRTARMDFLTGTGITAAARHVDYNGDAKSDLLWMDASTRGNVIWRGASNTDRHVVTAVSDPQWAIRGTGDFDGDGNSDLLWRHAVSGASTIWKTASSSDRQNLTGVTDQDWQVAGIGDFNGDGRSDILWRNARTGSNAIWRSGESSDYQALTAVAGSAWKIAGVGDFDGDSRSDILWRNTASGANTIWRSGNPADRLNITGVSNTDWKVAGVGDFDHDGKADLVWRNASTGINAIWKAANHTTQVGVFGVTNPSWKIASVGDYDGDGHSDLFWRDSSSGKGAIWKSGNYATQQAVATAPSPSWSLAP